MKVLIRKADASDSCELFRLNKKFNDVFDVAVEQIEKSIRENDREEVFVATIGDKLVGFCCVQIFKSFCYSVDYAEITEIFVEDDHQHKGIGAELLHYVEEYLKNINISNLQLFTGGTNYSAQAFYEKNGYTKTTEIMYRKRG